MTTTATSGGGGGGDSTSTGTTTTTTTQTNHRHHHRPNTAAVAAGEGEEEEERLHSSKNYYLRRTTRRQWIQETNKVAATEDITTADTYGGVVERRQRVTLDSNRMEGASSSRSTGNSLHIRDSNNNNNKDDGGDDGDDFYPVEQQQQQAQAQAQPKTDMNHVSPLANQYQDDIWHIEQVKSADATTTTTDHHNSNNGNYAKVTTDQIPPLANQYQDDIWHIEQVSRNPHQKSASSLTAATDRQQQKDAMDQLMQWQAGDDWYEGPTSGVPKNANVLHPGSSNSNGKTETGLEDQLQAGDDWYEINPNHENNDNKDFFGLDDGSKSASSIMPSSSSNNNNNKNNIRNNNNNNNINPEWQSQQHEQQKAGDVWYELNTSDRSTPNYYGLNNNHDNMNNPSQQEKAGDDWYEINSDNTRSAPNEYALNHNNNNNNNPSQQQEKAGDDWYEINSDNSRSAPNEYALNNHNNNNNNPSQQEKAGDDWYEINSGSVPKEYAFNNNNNNPSQQEKAGDDWYEINSDNSRNAPNEYALNSHNNNNNNPSQQEKAGDDWYEINSDNSRTTNYYALHQNTNNPSQQDKAGDDWYEIQDIRSIPNYYAAADLKSRTANPPQQQKQQPSPKPKPQEWKMTDMKNFLALVDFNHDTMPFCVERGAPQFSAFVAANGNVGLGTSDPKANLHLLGDNNNEDKPFVRFEQNGGGDGGNSVWDIVANEEGFSVYYQEKGEEKSQTGGGEEEDDRRPRYLPFQIAAKAPALSLVVSENSHVGLGTDSPTAKLHVLGDARIDGSLQVGTTCTLDTETCEWKQSKNRLRVLEQQQQYNPNEAFFGTMDDDDDNSASSPMEILQRLESQNQQVMITIETTEARLHDIEVNATKNKALLHQRLDVLEGELVLLLQKAGAASTATKNKDDQVQYYE
ncbi:hypothetical protein ACA910_017322 [Epithemia clementina (nom. ined.)]